MIESFNEFNWESASLIVFERLTAAIIDFRQLELAYLEAIVKFNRKRVKQKSNCTLKNSLAKRKNLSTKKREQRAEDSRTDSK